MSIRILLYSFVVTIVATTANAGENWPGWRGPSGMGQTDEKNLPVIWSGKTQQNVLWKAALFPSDEVERDHNQSSPTVWGNRIFVTVSYWPQGVTRKDFSEHHLLCFSAKDGKKLWDTSIRPGPWKLSDFRGGGYACSSPATDGRYIYAVFGSAVIAAVDFDGSIAWRKEIKPHNFDVAFAASPVVYPPLLSQGDGRVVKVSTVILVCDQMNKSSTIYAFDGKTGEIRWESRRPKVNWAHSTPLLANINNKLQLITATHNGPHGLDPATGETLWFFHESHQVGDTVTPIVRAGLLYVDSGRGGMGVAVDATGSGDVSKTHLKWSVPKVPEGFSSPVLVGDYLYRLHGPGLLTCLKWTTGEKVFQERLDGVETACSPIATADGRIYCASAGKSYVLKAGPTLEILARNDLDDASKASPAVAAGRIFLKGGRFLYCIGSAKD